MAPTSVPHTVSSGGSGGAAHVSSTEDAWLAWFREGRAALQNDLERQFEAAAPAAPSAIDLLAILPRNQSHSAHLLAAQQLPVTAFYTGNALEMLCYLSLQALPRHSRTYANLHLGGEWHDGIELRAVHYAMLQHEPSLLKGDAALVDETAATKTMHLSQAVDFNRDSFCCAKRAPETSGSSGSASVSGLGLAERMRIAAKEAVAAKKDAAAGSATEPGRAAGAALTVDTDGDEGAGVEMVQVLGSWGGGGKLRAARTIRFKAGSSASEESEGIDGSADDDEDDLIAMRLTSKVVSPSGRRQRIRGEEGESLLHESSANSPAKSDLRTSPTKSPQTLARAKSQNQLDSMTSAEKWATRQAEVDEAQRKMSFKSTHASERGGGGGGLLNTLVSWFGGAGRSRTGDVSTGDGADTIEPGWMYLDDFGREQGPFSTERMRAWLRRGHLTSDRKVRHAESEDAPFKQLWKWDELDVFKQQRRARTRWHNVRSAVGMGAAAHRRHLLNSSDNLDDINRAAQQRYARSAVGFDSLLNRLPFFRTTPVNEWPPTLVDAIVLITDLATVDKLSHIIGHYNGSNLGCEMVVELLSLGYWFMRPFVSMPGGLAQHVVAPLQLAVQRQWGLVMQRLCVWRRSLAVHAYWELNLVSSRNTADYSRALQFVNWSPADEDDAQAVAEYLQLQLNICGSLKGDPLQWHSQALTFTIESLRLPMLPETLAGRPMAVVQSWASYVLKLVAEQEAIQAKTAAAAAAAVQAAKAAASAAQWGGSGGSGGGGGGGGGGVSWSTASAAYSRSGRESEMGESGEEEDEPVTEPAHSADPNVAAATSAAAVASGGLDPGLVRRQLTLLELAAACIGQSGAEFFIAQVPVLIEALRPYLWNANAVEPALHVVLRLLRGCYHDPQPFWTVQDRFAPGLRDLTGGIAVNGAAFARTNSAMRRYLHRYSVSMYPGLGNRAHLSNLAHLHGVLFPGWTETANPMLRALQQATEHTPVGAWARKAGIGVLSELPHAIRLVDVLAEIVVCMASHDVQWTVEQVIIRYLLSAC